MERKFTFTDSMDDKQATMLLGRHIGPNPNDEREPYIDGAYFAEEMLYHHRQKRDITIRINSVGGHVLQGWAIVDAVILTEAKTHIAGLAASMAAIIAASGKKGHRTCNDFSTSMFHGPHGDSQSPYLEMIRSNFKMILTNRTKLDVKEVAAIMDEGDHYFDSSKMLENGIVDSVIVTNVNVGKKANQTASELYNIYNSYFETIKPKSTMDIWAKLFGGKTEDEAFTNAMELKNANATLLASEKALKEQITKLEAEKILLEGRISAIEATSVEQRVTAMVDKAIADNLLKVTDDQKKAIVASGVKDIKALEIMLGSIQPSVSAMAVIKGDHKAEETYEFLAKSNPQKLAEIAKLDPKLFERLQDEYIAKSKEKAE